MQFISFELRRAVRALSFQPTSAVAAILTLAMGLGANVAVFCLVYGLLWRELPFAEPERLIRLFQSYPERGLAEGAISHLDGIDWAAASQTVPEIGLYSTLSGGFTLLGRDQPTELRGAVVSGSFFPTLGVRPALGRTLTPADEVGDVAQVVLSWRAFQRFFGGDEAMVGSKIVLDGQPFTLLGVMPPDFRFPTAEVESWALLQVIPPDAIPRERFVHWLSAVGRMAPGVNVEQARLELSGIAAALADQYPDSNGGADQVTAYPLRDYLVREVRPAMLAAWAAAAAVLAIACVNLSHLLLARGLGRRRALAIASALGASRARLVRGLLAESLVLAAVGGAAGVLLASWGLDLLLLLAGPRLPRVANVALDWPVLAFAGAATLLVGLLGGVLPALQLSRQTPQEELKGGAGQRVAVGGARSGRALVAAEVALALLLALGTGLVVKSLVHLSRIEPGFSPANLLTVKLTLSDHEFPTRETHLGAWREMLAKVRALPGVDAASSVKDLSFASFDEIFPFSRADLPAPPRGQEPMAMFLPVDASFFQTLGLPIRAGRSLRDTDRQDTPLVAVVNETLVHQHLGGLEPVGARIRVGASEVEIVGVVPDVPYGGLTEAIRPALYFAQEQIPRIVFTFLVRSQREPAELAQAVAAAIREVAPDQAITRVAMVEDLLAEAFAPAELLSALASLFTCLALALAAIGIYGVVAAGVGQRTREIGVRMALGAHAGQVLVMVVRQGLQAVAIGLGVGLAVALWLGLELAPRLGQYLYGVAALDAWVFTLVPLLLLVVAVAACALPARRAARVDPVTALRSE